jgi:hypothetical protein
LANAAAVTASLAVRAGFTIAVLNSMVRIFSIDG